MELMIVFELYRYESILEFGLYIYKHTVVQKFSHLYTDVFDDIRLKIKFYIHTYIHLLKGQINLAKAFS